MNKSRDRMDDLIDAFESEWRAGRRPEIERYLKDVSAPAGSKILRELVALDLEYRLRAGEAARVEDCLSRFPELQTDREAAIALIALEFRVRLDCAEKVTVAEYLDRFPTLRDSLPGALEPLRRGPQEVPGYEMLEELGRGGMGIVYRAVDLEFGRPVALKLVHPGRPDQTEAVARFHAEAHVMGRLQHPGIPPVHRLGALHDGQPFLAMKLIQGTTLAALLAQRSAPDAEVARFLQIFESLCQTMAYAHEQGVVHRDLKPSNVMVGAFGEVQVMDWGLAKYQGSATNATGAAHPADVGVRTQTGAVLGTPAYMPPEQALGEAKADPRADVFTLGAILCEILTGQPPYAGADDVLDAAANARLEPALQRLTASGCPVDLVDLARRCLARHPVHRLANANEVAQAVTAHRLSVEQELRRAERERSAAETKAAEERKRRRVHYALAAVLALLIVGTLGAAWRADRQATARRIELEVRADNARSAVAAALDQADQSLRADRPIEARIALAEAKRRLDADSHADPDQNLAARLDNLQQQQHLLVELEAIRDRQGTSMGGAFDDASARRDLPIVFQKFGIDLTQPKAAVNRMRDWAIRAQALGGLDLWLAVENKQARLPELLALLDPDPQRNAWRAAVAANDADRRIAAASALTDPKQPPRFLAAHAERLPAADALRLLRPAWARQTNSLSLAFALARVLSRGTREQQEEAIGYYRVCLGIRPDHAASLINIGARLLAKGDSDGAVTWSRIATEMAPGRAEGHFNLGVSLYAKKDLEGAIASYRKAIELEPALSRAFTNLGVIWMEKAEAEPDRGDDFRAEAIQCYRKAIEVDAKDFNAQINLGYALKAQGDLAGALGCFRKATELRPKDAIAWCDLGLCLRGQGQFAEAVAALRRGHEIGHADPEFQIRSRKWLDECESLREVDRRLQRILAGDAIPASATECVELATFCTLYGQRFAEAVRLYDDAGFRDQRLAIVVRYRKACAAVRAANGDGLDAPKVESRSALRKQALAWVREDLALWQKSFPLAPRGLQNQMLKMLTQRLNEPDLISVRSASGLVTLPETERQAWEAYWNDLRRTVRENTK